MTGRRRGPGGPGGGPGGPGGGHGPGGGRGPGGPGGGFGGPGRGFRPPPPPPRRGYGRRYGRGCGGCMMPVLMGLSIVVGAIMLFI